MVKQLFPPERGTWSSLLSYSYSSRPQNTTTPRTRQRIVEPGIHSSTGGGGWGPWRDFLGGPLRLRRDDGHDPDLVLWFRPSRVSWGHHGGPGRTEVLELGGPVPVVHTRRLVCGWCKGRHQSIVESRTTPHSVPSTKVQEDGSRAQHVEDIEPNPLYPPFVSGSPSTTVTRDTYSHEACLLVPFGSSCHVLLTRPPTRPSDPSRSFPGSRVSCLCAATRVLGSLEQS